jgi:hypothetical protein
MRVLKPKFNRDKVLWSSTFEPDGSDIVQTVGGTLSAEQGSVTVSVSQTVTIGSAPTDAYMVGELGQGHSIAIYGSVKEVPTGDSMQVWWAVDGALSSEAFFLAVEATQWRVYKREGADTYTPVGTWANNPAVDDDFIVQVGADGAITVRVNGTSRITVAADADYLGNSLWALVWTGSDGELGVHSTKGAFVVERF